MSQQPEVLQMSLVGLGYRCKQQTERFWQRLSSDAQFCYELMRRALTHPHAEDGKTAWGFVYRQYERQARLWVKKHKSFPSTGLEPAELADLALEKMWMTFARNEGKFERFPQEADQGLKALLKFLQLCIHSVVLDNLRPNQTSLDEDNNTIEPATEDNHDLDSAEYWQCVYNRLNNDEERILVDALYLYGLKPRQIYDLHKDTFASVKAVYRTKENVLARLRRDESLAGVLIGSSSRRSDTELHGEKKEKHGAIEEFFSISSVNLLVTSVPLCVPILFKIIAVKTPTPSFT